MTIVKKLLLLTVFTLSLGIFFSVSPDLTSAQTCTGAVNCKRYGIRTVCNGGIGDGQSCDSNFDCIGGSCDSEQYIADRDTKGCNDNPTLACRAGCQELGAGWEPDGGGCTEVPPPPPPPPPSVRYNCNTSNYTCYNAGSSGYYSTYTSCTNNCKPSAPPPPPQATPEPEDECIGCGCPGEPACNMGCYDEHDCGDINVYDCCQGSCVPQGTQCSSGGCSSIGYTIPTNVWFRVVSNDGSGGTIAWKGTQTNDPITTSDTSWSGNGIDANGYFQIYQPYQGEGQVQFDQTRNRIDSRMRVNVSNSPIGNHFFTNKCGETETTYVGTAPAHGLAWSNHFCAAGWAWAQENGPYPGENKRRSEDYYYTDMTGSSSNYMPVPDPDGCYGLLRNPIDTAGIDKSYHQSLVPFLRLADQNHWADLSYAGYWSAAYQAYEELNGSSQIDSMINVMPPNGHTCNNVRWWGKQAQDTAEREYGLGAMSNLDGSCTIRFNPKKYGNFIVLELGKSAPDESCSVQLEDPYTNPNVLISNLSIDKKSDFVAHVTGYSTEPTPPNKEKVNLWMAKDDFSKIEDWIPGDGKIFEKFTEVYSGGKYYYRHDDPTGLNQQCLTNSEQACSMSVRVTDTTMALFNQAIFSEGTYHVFCDVVEPTSVCSGNPACSMNGGSLACTGYNDCTPDTSTPNDHATLTVSCIPQCNNSCAAAAYDNGCGNPTGCQPGSQYGPPGSITVTEPYATKTPDNVVPYSYQVSWAISEGTKADYFDVVTYKQGAYANVAAAIAAKQAGATDVYHKQISATAGQLNYSTTVDVTSTQDWQLTVGVQGSNSSCGTPQISEGYANFNLIGSVSGDIMAVSGNQCSGGTRITNAPYPNVQTGTTVTTTDDIDLIPNFSLQTATMGFGNPLGSIVNGQYSVNFLPFSPPMWGKMVTTRLQIQNADLSQAYVCAACNRESLFVCRAGGLAGGSYIPQSNLNFYVQLINLANEAWWQLNGGNAYGRNGLVSTVPSSCTSGANCNPTIIGNLSGASNLNSAGIPMSNSTISNSGGFYSENNIEPTNPNVGNPRGQLTTAQFSPTLENFTYFLVNADVPVPSIATNPGANLLINTPITNRTQFKAAFGANYREINGETIVWVDNSLTVDLTASTANWNVPSGEKWIVFVPGDLTFTGPTDHSQAAQQYLISVQSGGFLAFIAKGDITFNENLGYGFDDDTDMAQFQTPIVEGVFIASDTLVVKSKGGSTPGDYKFVGAGTFVGWTGVDLERTFDNGATRKSLHNNSPTELFIYRPDFMSNAPVFLNKAQMRWKEVN